MNCKRCGKPLPSEGVTCKFCGMLMSNDEINTIDHPIHELTLDMRNNKEEVKN